MTQAAAATKRPARALGTADLEKVMAHIRANYRRVPSLEELAKLVHISYFHFHRRFKAAAGKTPAAVIKQMRIDEAKRLVRDTDVPYATIAEALGWANQSHFTNAFHREVGVSPRRYRKGARA